MPSSNEPASPPTGAATKPGTSLATVNPLHALFGALILATAGTAALIIDYVGFWLALMWLFYAGSVVVLICAVAIWAGKRRRNPVSARRAGPFDHLNDAGDGVCS